MDRPGERLWARIEAALSQCDLELAIVARRMHCLSQCKRPCVVAFSHPDRFTYIFGDLDPDRASDDVVSAFRLWLSRSDGFMARAERPPDLQTGILGRIPPLGRPHALIQGERVLGPSRPDYASDAGAQPPAASCAAQ